MANSEKTTLFGQKDVRETSKMWSELEITKDFELGISILHQWQYTLPTMELGRSIYDILEAQFFVFILLITGFKR